VTFTGVSANHTLVTTYVATTFTITPSAGAHGTFNPATPQTVAPGYNKTFKVLPDTGYHVSDVKKDGTSIGASTSVTFAAVSSDHTISATFGVNTYTITPYVGKHGSVTPGVATSVNYGANKTFKVTPDTGYHISDVLKDGTSIGASSSVTFTSVTANHTLVTTFAINSYTITPYIGKHGTVTPNSAQAVTYGSSKTFAVAADAGYHIADVVIDGGSVGASSSVTFTSVAANHTLVTTFAINTYTITPTFGSHGTITPGTLQSVNWGTSKTFSVTADPGYQIADVVKDGTSIGASSTVTFTNVIANHTISATFAGSGP
jgi:hypothetical protein